MSYDHNTYMKAYYRKYPWKHLLILIRLRCNNPEDWAYKWYGAKGIKCLITEKELEFLYKRDKANQMKKPSIDRINNKGNYTLQNCKFIEQSENSSKDKFKKILQFDLNKNLIREWASLQEAERELPCNRSGLIECLKGRKLIFKGFIWKYKTD